MIDIDSRHPSYLSLAPYWAKWRLTYEAGDEFIETYLERYTARESSEEFNTRKGMSYCPAFAKTGLNEVKNAIFSRMCDIRRIGGPVSYQRLVNNDVDLSNTSMNAFLGEHILPELLSLGRVGIYVDAPAITPATLLHNVRPYLYYYNAEDILNWAFDSNGNPVSILLRDHSFEIENGLPNGIVETYRHCYFTDGLVTVDKYNDDGELIASMVTELQKIPFTLLQLPTSLLSEVANYQIALLNMESSDLNYIIRANFPFYTEQYNEKQELGHFKQFSPDGTDTETPENKEIVVGISQGRRYDKDLDRPEFIHPSPEPLLASMKKGEQLRQDIRKLINLAVDDLKSGDGLRDGLSFIALILEKAERKVADFWANYTNEVPAQIFYPEDFSIHTDATRIEKAQGLDEMKNKIVSATYQKEISKRIVDALLGGKLSQERIMDIYQEIDDAPTLTSDPKVIHLDFENGLVGTKTASIARGYSPEEYKIAQQDRADRIRLTMEAQGGQGGAARGVLDTQVTQQSSLGEKEGKPVRGEGHLNV